MKRESTIKRIGYLCCFVLYVINAKAQGNLVQKRTAAWLQVQRFKLLGISAPTAATVKANKPKRNPIQVLDVAPCDGTGIFCSAVLPVEGLQLDGKRLTADKVQLAWHTLTETNNKGFVLERSFNNSSNIYDSIGFVIGVGNTQSKTSYNYYDANSYSQTSFYRLKQVDVDGGFKYSNTIAVKGILAPFNVSVAPNPTLNGHVNLRFTGNSINDKITVRIINAIGKEVYKNENIELGSANIFSIDNLTLTAGLYMVSVRNGNDFKSLQLVVAR